VEIRNIMPNNLLSEPPITGGYYDEYLRLVNSYQNFKRKSIFLRYLNINVGTSEREDTTEGTYDKHRSGIIYDIYDYTPAYLTSQVINRSTNREDLNGLKFDGELEIVIYTIDTPRINDLITFPYEPLKADEVFRVREVNTALNALHKDVKHFRLTLEYAPLTTLTDLNYINMTVYSMIREENVPQKLYLRILQQVEVINEAFKIAEQNFDEKTELYYYNYNGKKIAPLDINKKIYKHLSEKKNFKRYFTKVRMPYGINSNMREGTTLSNIAIELNPNIPQENDYTICETPNPMSLVLPFINPYMTGTFSLNCISEYNEHAQDPILELVKYKVNPDTVLFDLPILLDLFEG
jgi:hypothetical protein